MRFFNTEGPIRPGDHYAIPPLSRMDLDDLLELVNGKRHFVMHAPRQTGKTSALIALRDLLNSGEVGAFRCVDVNVEVGQVARDDVAEDMRAILGSLASSAQWLGDDYPGDIWPDLLAKVGPNNALKELLHRWCVVIDRRGEASARRRPDDQSSSEGGTGADRRRVTVWRL